MSAKFVVSHLDEQLGPFDEEELKVKWLKGDLLPIDYVYDDAKQDWILLAERFAWAAAKPEGASPPPIRNDIIKRRRPVEPMNPVITPQLAQTAAKGHPIIEVPTLNIPIAPAATAPAPQPAATAPAPAPQAASTPTPAVISGKQIEISGNSLMKEWKKTVGSQGAKVKLVDGMGEIDLSPLQPGQVELMLQDSSSAMLKLQQPLRVQVRAAEPAEVVWAFATQQVVGQDLEIMIKAVDANGAVCTHYSEAFTLSVEGQQPQSMNVNLKDGQALVKFNHTKAEPWKLSLTYSGSRNLKLPEAKNFEWHPGPAAKLVLDGPASLVAGSPLKVQVKAVDAFGNLAKTFQGTVILEVKAS